MSEQEGVIKYQLEHLQLPITHTFLVKEITAWRAILFRLGLIGQDPDRYDNLGFGNISHRVKPNSDAFIITGTQTGHIEYLFPEQFVWVDKAEPKQNRIHSHGLIKPSSEALTHASIYSLDATVQAVIHVHSPEIWGNTKALNLPHIAADIPYGTVAMAVAVEQLFKEGGLDNPSVFSMLGHQDGVVALGKTMQEAALELISFLSLTLQNKCIF
ncbi:MAG: class II aldolase/adducin family protein [Methylococcales bacterium]